MQYKILNGAVSYDGNMVLENVDIEINDREKIAIIGENGIGKSIYISTTAIALKSEILINLFRFLFCGQMLLR